MITVKFFAGFREKVGKDEISIAAENIPVEGLLKMLERKVPGIASLFSERRATVAINRKVAKSGDIVRDGDVVAVFPPVSGG